nr:putative reverse transcriptase domain-containing protein [Tanacetum cinerariifolium]
VNWTGIGTRDDWKVVLIKKKLKAARYRQKRYADNRRKPLEFEVGDHVLLKVNWTGIGTRDDWKVVLIKKKLKAARYRQKRYADNRRKPLEFEVGDHVLLKVSPWKGVIRFRKKGKLAPMYVGPFEILERKYLADLNLHVPLDEIKVDKTLCFVEEPVEILDCEFKSLKRSKISIVKVHWN